MKRNMIIVISIIIHIVSIGVIYNFIKKDYLSNEKILVKAMTGSEYESNITSLNTSHEDFANYIKESKKKIASAITEMGIETLEKETFDTMVNNIKNINTGMDFENITFSFYNGSVGNPNKSTLSSSIIDIGNENNVLILMNAHANNSDAILDSTCIYRLLGSINNNDWEIIYEKNFVRPKYGSNSYTETIKLFETEYKYFKITYGTDDNQTSAGASVNMCAIK